MVVVVKGGGIEQRHPRGNCKQDLCSEKAQPKGLSICRVGGWLGLKYCNVTHPHMCQYIMTGHFFVYASV